MKNRVNRAFMAKKKKQYFIPTTETLPLEAFGSIMKTSVVVPLAPAPSRRHTQVF